MQLIHKRDIILSVRDRWREQYRHYTPDTMFSTPPEPKSAIDARLDKLDLATCSEADVDKAIGRKGWVALECDECDENFETVIRIGQEPEYEARWQDLCSGCLAKALEMMTK